MSALIIWATKSPVWIFYHIKNGTSLVRFPTVEVVREAFLLYHMNIIPREITHTPTITNNAKISVGGIQKRVVFIYILKKIIK